MTRVQDIILSFLKQEYISGTYKATPIGLDKMCIITNANVNQVLSTNLFGDIIDTGSGKIIATSNVPHDISYIFVMPTCWTLKNSK